MGVDFKKDEYFGKVNAGNDINPYFKILLRFYAL